MIKSLKLNKILSILILVFIFVFMIALLGRVAYLQLVDGDKLQTQATSRQTLTETLSAKRGNIYDSTGDTLAFSYDTDKVYINPSSIEDDHKETIARNLAGILEIDEATLLAKLNNSTSRFLVASNVEKAQIDNLKNWKKLILS